MPKDRVDKSVDSRTSPYPRKSKNADKCQSKIELPPVVDRKEWEEARCPVCLEHPHNAVLLLCSSRECHPYMCDTSYRHSNCLDQFRKSSSAAPSALPEEVSLSNAAYPGRIGELRSQSTRIHGGQNLKLVCPLCRGQITGWVVIDAARQFMNSKPRSCSLETCDFSGNYSELRRHARCKHPAVRPSEADPRRQHDWRTLEQRYDFEDFLGTYLEPFLDESAEDLILGDPDLSLDTLLNDEFDFIDDPFWSEFDLSSGSIGIEHDILDLQEALLEINTDSVNELSGDMSLVMDTESELPFTFLNSWFDTELGSSAGSQSHNRRSTWSRPSYPTETISTTRRSRTNTPGLRGWGQQRPPSRRSRRNN